MDQPGLDETLHRQALAGLRTVNQFSRSGAIVWPEVRRLAGQSREGPLRVLDVGSGGGDIAVWVARRAAAAGVQVEIDGCDISPLAVAHANEYAATQRAAHVRFFRCSRVHPRRSESARRTGRLSGCSYRTPLAPTISSECEARCMTGNAANVADLHGSIWDAIVIGAGRPVRLRHVLWRSPACRRCLWSAVRFRAQRSAAAV